MRVFEPTHKPMKEEYPELKDITSFKRLSDEELRFAWYHSNPTSPLIEKFRVTENTVEDRIKEAARRSFRDNKVAKHKADMYLEEMPMKIKAACNRMARMAPLQRVESRKLVEKIYKNFKKIVNKNVDEMSIDEQKKYSEMALKITNDLPNLISKLENGFGVQEDVSYDEDDKPIKKEGKEEKKEKPSINNIEFNY